MAIIIQVNYACFVINGSYYCTKPSKEYNYQEFSINQTNYLTLFSSDCGLNEQVDLYNNYGSSGRLQVLIDLGLCKRLNNGGAICSGIPEMETYIHWVDAKKFDNSTKFDLYEEIQEERFGLMDFCIILNNTSYCTLPTIEEKYELLNQNGTLILLLSNNDCNPNYIADLYVDKFPGGLNELIQLGICDRLNNGGAICSGFSEFTNSYSYLTAGEIENIVNSYTSLDNYLYLDERFSDNNLYWTGGKGTYLVDDQDDLDISMYIPNYPVGEETYQADDQDDLDISMYIPNYPVGEETYQADDQDDLDISMYIPNYPVEDGSNLNEELEISMYNPNFAVEDGSNLDEELETSTYKPNLAG